MVGGGGKGGLGKSLQKDEKDISSVTHGVQVLWGVKNLGASRRMEGWGCTSRGGAQ